MWLAVRQCWVLFVGLLLFMLGNGLQGTLIGVRTQSLEYGNILTGLIMGGYFVGMFLGSIFAPNLISRVGHVRVFGAVASLASIAILVFPMISEPFTWFIMRVIIGFSFAGLYIVVESWLNDRATNETRGQVLGIYMIITLLGFSFGQLMLNLSDPETFELFALVSILISIAVIPVLVSAQPMPSFEAPDRMSLMALYKITPLGITVIALVGLANGVFLGLGGPYMIQQGFSNAEVSYFLAIYSIGGLCCTYPLGKLSDIQDRRKIIIAAATIAVFASFAGTWFGINRDIIPLLLASFVFGGMALPLYSLCLAHTNDLLKPSQMVAASSTLLLMNGFGSIIGATAGGFIMNFGGAKTFFMMLSAIHIAIALYAFWRFKQRSFDLDAEDKNNYIPISARASSVASALNPDAEWPEYYQDDYDPDADTQTDEPDEQS
ncbi:MAG: MFS transporter, partial [Alphaproteobacteria bacterium]